MNGIKNNFKVSLINYYVDRPLLTITNSANDVPSHKLCTITVQYFFDLFRMTFVLDGLKPRVVFPIMPQILCSVVLLFNPYLDESHKTSGLYRALGAKMNKLSHYLTPINFAYSKR